MHPTRILLASILFLSFLPALVEADEATHPRWEETLYVNLGAYFLDADVEYAITRTGDPRRKVDLGDLGIDDSIVTPMLELGWRFKQRWSLTAHYFRFDESGNLRNERELPIGGIVFPVGVTLDSNVRVDTYMLNLGYSFIKDQRKELGAGVGVHGFDFESDVTGRAFIGDIPIPFADSYEDFVAPLPNLRVFGRYAINSRWLTSFKGGWLSADIDNYSGDLWLFDARLEYSATSHLGLGLGYLWTRADVEVNKNKKDEEYDVEFSGLLLYLSYNF